ncbi:unnamed protein product [Parajaminaea phylloscopi]
MAGSLTIEALRDHLAALNLDTHGKKDQLQKRLRKARAKLRQTQEEEAKAEAKAREPWRPKYRNFLLLDVEATCEQSAKGHGFQYPNEIIELPVILVGWREDASDDSPVHRASRGDTADMPPRPRAAGRLEVIDEFHTYVRPSVRPELSAFCTQLTGVTSEQLRDAPTFPQALSLLHRFLESHGLLRSDTSLEDRSPTPTKGCVLSDPMHELNRCSLRKDTVWCTHGPFDLRDFVPKQCWISGFTYGPPRWMQGPILDLRKAVGKWKQYHRLDYVQAGSDLTATALQEPVSRNESTGSRSATTTCHAAATVLDPGLDPDPAIPRDGTIPALLADLHLGEFRGRLHNGLDDTRNLARILIGLAGKVAENLYASDDKQTAEAESTAGLTHTSSAARSNGGRSLSATVVQDTRPTGNGNSSAMTARFAASRLLEPNVTLPALPPIPALRHHLERGSSSRFYVKRYFWMGKRVGTVDWDAVQSQSA